ncbi:MAG: patatin-like phospholipase family protein [Proteobacteria bacterium]|nr:patatin-like phospholipase family protein [Pseudomonadota bacterium]
MRFSNLAYTTVFSLMLTTSIFSCEKQNEGSALVDELLSTSKGKTTSIAMPAPKAKSQISAGDVELEVSLPESKKLHSSLTQAKQAQQPRLLSIISIPTEALLRRGLSGKNSPELLTLQSPETPRPRWLLSLDGGGIRGLMQLQIIAEIERITKKSIIELFDAVAGTSIGGIIASLLTMPDPLSPKKPKYSAQDLLNIFVARQDEMFKSKWKSLGGLFGTRYKTTPFINLLKDLAGDNKFSNRLLPTVLVTHNLITNEEQLFSSRDHEDFYTWAIAAATGAAPTYFKPQRVFPVGCHPSHRGYVLSDGGTCMNNPTMAGVALMHEVYSVDADDLNVVSLGTGTSGTSQLNTQLLRGGILSWGFVIANTCIAGQASSTNKLAELYCKDKYHRLNPVVDQNNMALDNISEENQDALFAATYQCLKDNHQELMEIVEGLNASADSKKSALKKLRFKEELEIFRFGDPETSKSSTRDIDDTDEVIPPSVEDDEKIAKKTKDQ